MPLVGLLLASAFRFEADVAAGCVLIGSVPGGVSSNLITYLAGGDVALSVTMTACSTLISPLMTPAMMKLLASRYVEISFSAMALDICNMILAPIVAGLVANKILYGEVPAFRRGGVLGCVALACVAIVAIVGLPGGALLGSVRGGVIVGTARVGLMALAKLVVEIQLRGPKNWMDHALPLLSMAAICLIMLIIAARSAADLIRVGPLLVTAAMLHNLLGYLLGYWAARLARLDERVCRTVAIEVGLQNGALATGLAINTLRTASAALAAAVFAPWSVISGSLLASWWRRRSTSRGG
jgi:BASS family bile acid:Na+ symporter